MRSCRWRRKAGAAAANHPFVAGGDTRLTVDSPATARKYGPKPGEGRQGPHYRSWGLDPGVRYRSGFLDRADDSADLGDTGFHTPVVGVGGRLPHAWVRHNGARVSTPDLAARDTLTDLTTPATQALLLRPDSHIAAVVEAAGLRIVIVHSAIAMNATPEVAGVISLTVSAPSAAAGRDAITSPVCDRLSPPPRHRRRRRCVSVVPRPERHGCGHPAANRSRSQ